MIDIRRGNDIPLVWKIYQVIEGERVPYDLEGRDVTIVISSHNFCLYPSFSIVGNEARFTFYGKDQTQNGEFTYTFIENNRKVGMKTIDKITPHRLVPRQEVVESGSVDGETSTLEVSPIVLESDFEGQTGGGSSNYLDLSNKPQINGVTLVGNKTSEDLGLTHPYVSLERIRPYLYRVTFDSLAEDNGGESVIGGCSAYVENGKLYRNLDWQYDNAASFIVRTRDFEGMSFITGLDDGSLDDSLIAQLPYRMVDGRNNNGIMVSTHILFNDWAWTGCGDKSIPLTRLPFLILKNVKSMETIESDLDGIINNLSSTAGLDALGYLIQILVTDGYTTYALIPPTSDNQPFVCQDITSCPKLTNFRWINKAEVVRGELQNRPTGVERWNMMPCPLEWLRFTLAYEEPTRLSEFIGLRETTKDSTDAELEAIYYDARDLYLERTRNGETWQTMHSVIYGDRMESLFIQENWNDDCVSSGVSKEYVDGEIARVEAKIPDADDFATKEDLEDVEFIVSGKQDIIPDLETIRSNASDGKDASTLLGGHSVGKDVPSDAVFTDTIYDDTALQGRVSTIEGKIPSQASTSNQLADKNFVNSSVQTATANFRGNWSTKASIPSDVSLYPADYAGNRVPTVNDYLVVQADESQDGGTWRYKYSGVWATDGKNGWNVEYEVNETPMTAAQLAALNSGITEGKVQQIDANTTAISGKQDTIDASHKLPYAYLSDTPTIPTPPTIDTSLDGSSVNTDVAGAKAAYDAANSEIVSNNNASVNFACEAGKTYKAMLSTGVTSLAFSLTAPSDNAVRAIWTIKFRSGATATNVTWPAGILYPKGQVPTIEANAVYELCIDEDYCLNYEYYKTA